MYCGWFIIPYPPKPTGELEPRPVFKPVFGIVCYEDDNVGFYTFLDLFKTIITVELFNPKAPAFSLSFRTLPLNTNLISNMSKSTKAAISSLYYKTVLFSSNYNSKISCDVLVDLNFIISFVVSYDDVIGLLLSCYFSTY